MNVFYKTVALGLCGSMLSAVAFASSVPPTVSPGRSGDAQRPQPVIEDVLSDELSSPAPVTEGNQNHQKTFLLTDVRISGNTALSNDTLRHHYSPYLGQSVSLLTLNHIAKEITRTYRKNGYFLSRAIVPEQSITDGVVSILVVEGYVSDLRIEGHDYEELLKNDRAGVIARFSQLVTGMRPFNINTMQNQLLLMNDTGFTASSVVFSALPAASAPVGAAGMTLTLDV